MISFPKYNFIIAIRKNLFIYIAILVGSFKDKWIKDQLGLGDPIAPYKE